MDNTFTNTASRAPSSGHTEAGAEAPQTVQRPRDRLSHEPCRGPPGSGPAERAQAAQADRPGSHPEGAQQSPAPAPPELLREGGRRDGRRA